MQSHVHTHKNAHKYRRKNNYSSKAKYEYIQKVIEIVFKLLSQH